MTTEITIRCCSPFRLSERDFTCRILDSSIGTQVKPNNEFKIKVLKNKLEQSGIIGVADKDNNTTVILNRGRVSNLKCTKREGVHRLKNNGDGLGFAINEDSELRFKSGRNIVIVRQTGSDQSIQRR